MKVATVADIHVGNHQRMGGAYTAGINRRCELVLQVLNDALDKAEELGIGTVIVAGDLVDAIKQPPQVIAAIQQVMLGRRLTQESGSAPSPRRPFIYILKGNHDHSSEANGDHALGPFACLGNVEVIERPVTIDVEGVDLILIPYQPGNAREWLPEVMKERAAVADRAPIQLVFTHVGIIDNDTAPWLRDSHDALTETAVRQSMVTHEFTAFFAGNWHEHKVWPSNHPDGTRCIVQIGSLCPTGFDNPGLEGYGTLVVWDTDKEEQPLSVYEIPGPRFLKLKSSADREQIHRGTRAGHRLFVEFSVALEDQPTAVEVLAQLKQGEVIEGGEAHTDRKAVEEQTRAAAEAASSQETLDEALVAFVTEMPLEHASIDRQKVIERSREYLKKGSS